MLYEIRQLANKLDLSDGSLLKLARDISQDGALLSVSHMRSADLESLLAFLERAWAHQTQMVVA